LTLAPQRVAARARAQQKGGTRRRMPPVVGVGGRDWRPANRALS